MYVTLAGGVGAARFLAGLTAVVPPEQVVAIVNTGDDLTLYGLAISPDIDTVLYTLSGRVDPERGWGIAGDTTIVLDALAALGEQTTFRLGDRDLATHLFRTSLLHAGKTLTEVTALLAERLGVRARILPMADEPVRTIVQTPAGELAFQEYFVTRGQQDDVLGLRYAGAETARPTPAVREAIASAHALIIAPSNPFVSIGTILAVPGMREAIAASPATKVAISPIVGGRALKGPADKMLVTLGHEPSALGVARLYRDLVDLFVLDTLDASLAPAVEALGLRVLVTNTIMRGPQERAQLARAVLGALR
ncbi:MAG: 2-phospho-L-lactate transferase [Chloroflexota bacterium]|nr:2-phospho-L-lactate transferase [Dehalococcoidia bacterium]MDW8254418.1 2-phospho-L-lactate transferase [Chloroflexota bacterium]